MGNNTCIIYTIIFYTPRKYASCNLKYTNWNNKLRILSATSNQLARVWPVKAKEFETAASLRSSNGPKIVCTQTWVAVLYRKRFKINFFAKLINKRTDFERHKFVSLRLSYLELSMQGSLGEECEFFLHKFQNDYFAVFFKLFLWTSVNEQAQKDI